MTKRRVLEVVAVFGVIGCVALASSWAKGGKRRRGRKAGGPVAKATITIEAKDYQISLIPVKGGREKRREAGAAGAGGAKKKNRKRGRGKGAIVTVGGKPYRVRIVPADQVGAGADEKGGRKKAKGGGKRGGKGGRSGKRRRR